MNSVLAASGRLSMASSCSGTWSLFSSNSSNMICSTTRTGVLLKMRSPAYRVLFATSPMPLPGTLRASYGGRGSWFTFSRTFGFVNAGSCTIRSALSGVVMNEMPRPLSNLVEVKTQYSFVLFAFQIHFGGSHSGDAFLRVWYLTVVLLCEKWPQSPVSKHSSDLVVLSGRLEMSIPWT